MLKPSLALAALLLLSPALSFAADSLGNVTKALRPTLNTYDAAGAPTGPLKAADLKLPAPIVGYGKGQSLGVKVKDKVVYLRGLDVQTDTAAKCEPVQDVARAKGTSYAATGMGMGQPCKK